MPGRFPPFRSRALLACVPVLGLVTLASAGAASAARAPVHARATARTALEHLLAHWHPTNLAPHGTSLTQVKSLNWSGYADGKTTARYGNVAGHWTQPAGKCGSAQSLAVFWVGIDGFNGTTVEQDGTGIFCPGGGVAPVYFSWWEMFPANSAQVVGMTVKPGDHIAASVTRSSTSYTLKLTDSTTSGNSLSTTQACALTTCKDTSAEWIAERPASSTGKLSPLTNFGTWTVTGAAVKAGTTSGTISSFPDNEITMASSSGKILAQPGPLNSTGTSFKVTWKASK